MANYTIPNAAAALTFPQQAAPDSGDYAIMTGAPQRTGVVTGCAVSPGNSGGDKSITVAYGSVLIAGTQVVVATQTIVDASVPADGTSPRWALVTVNTSGVAEVTMGTPLGTPVYPTVPTDKVVVGVVWIPATATNITGTNIVAKGVPVHNPILHESEWTRGLGLFAASPVTRRTWAPFGGPGGSGANLAASTSYTLLDTGDATNGGVSGQLTSPGVVHAINIYLGPSVAWPWFEEAGIEVYYDGQTVPSIRMPLRNWSATNGSSTTSTQITYRHRFTDWMTNVSTTNLSFSFKVPIPFSSRCKIVLVTPGTGNTNTIGSWALCDYSIGSNLGFGSAKLRSQWWSRTAWTSPSATYSQLSDVAATNSTGFYTLPTTYTTAEATPASTIAGSSAWDAGWGTRLAGSTAVTSATTVLSVFNAQALIRNLPVGVTDPRTGTTIVNNTGPSGPGAVMNPAMYAWIDQECVQITAIDTTANTITVTRGVNDPITGAATTAVSHSLPATGYPQTNPGHPGDNVTRILGPVRVVATMIGSSNNNQLEGPVGLFLDKEVGWDWSSGGNGFIGSVGSGGTEDFFGTGWYGAFTTEASTGTHGLTGDPDRYMVWSTGSTTHNFVRWFHNDPVYGQYGVNFRWQSCERGNAGVADYAGSTTLLVYTSH